MKTKKEAKKLKITMEGNKRNNANCISCNHNSTNHISNSKYKCSI